MKITLDLNEKLMIKYARFLGYKEDELLNLNKSEFFKFCLAEIIEGACEYSLCR